MPPGASRPQTRKLFEVCRLRDMPVATFINKMDRDGRDPFDLIDEVEQTLQIEIAPASWPIGMGRDFMGCYDLVHDCLVLMARSKGETIGEGIASEGIDAPELDELLPPHAVSRLRDEVEMVRELMMPFDREAYLAGNLSPLYFGSALNNFGVRELIEGLVHNAPSPGPQHALERTVDPTRGGGCRLCLQDPGQHGSTPP